ncbi:hypothetical protein FIM02_01080 [SAR202 cluster bacterium AD-802-E10_MRT_200m]|nr:hypothetical protein [SAR202 cluster bacterium AD-802-E10_MRT_200m]
MYYNSIQSLSGRDLELILRQLINQNSYILITLILFVIGVVFVCRANTALARMMIISCILTPILLFGFLLKNGTSSVDSSEEVNQMVLDGQPTVLVFYSDY